jgi:hypothetical protein
MVALITSVGTRHTLGVPVPATVAIVAVVTVLCDGTPVVIAVAATEAMARPHSTAATDTLTLPWRTRRSHGGAVGTSSMGVSSPRRTTVTTVSTITGTVHVAATGVAVSIVPTTSRNTAHAPQPGRHRRRASSRSSSGTRQRRRSCSVELERQGTHVCGRAAVRRHRRSAAAAAACGATTARAECVAGVHLRLPHHRRPVHGRSDLRDTTAHRRRCLPIVRRRRRDHALQLRRRRRATVPRLRVARAVVAGLRHLLVRLWQRRCARRRQVHVRLPRQLSVHRSVHAAAHGKLLLAVETLQLQSLLLKLLLALLRTRAAPPAPQQPSHTIWIPHRGSTPTPRSTALHHRV